MSSNEEKEDNEDVMINTPEGFDARTMCYTQRCLPGIPIRPVIKSNLMQNVWEPNLQKETALKPLWAQKCLVKEGGTTSRSS